MSSSGWDVLSPLLSRLATEAIATSLGMKGDNSGYWSRGGQTKQFGPRPNISTSKPFPKEGAEKLLAAEATVEALTAELAETMREHAKLIEENERLRKLNATLAKTVVATREIHQRYHREMVQAYMQGRE